MRKKGIQNYKRKIVFMAVNIYWSLILTEDVQIQYDYTHCISSSRCWKQSTENSWPYGEKFRKSWIKVQNYESYQTGQIDY